MAALMRSHAVRCRPPLSQSLRRLRRFIYRLRRRSSHRAEGPQGDQPTGREASAGSATVMVSPPSGLARAVTVAVVGVGDGGDDGEAESGAVGGSGAVRVQPAERFEESGDPIRGDGGPVLRIISPASGDSSDVTCPPGWL